MNGPGSLTHSGIEAQAKAYVQRWFCHNNEILWERGGHYKEEVEALTQLLREASRQGVEELTTGKRAQEKKT